MSTAQELRNQLNDKEQAERAECERKAEESRKWIDEESNRIAPMMFRTCIDKCKEETAKGRDHTTVTFDGRAAQYAATQVVGRLVKEGFGVSTRNDSYGFRMNSEGYTLSEGTPYVAFDISW